MCIQTYTHTHTPHSHVHTHPIVFGLHSWDLSELETNSQDEPLTVLENSSLYSKGHRMQPDGSTQTDSPGEIELQAVGSKKLNQRSNSDYSKSHR